MDFSQNPARKTWWAKRICSRDYYTAGRLTERQIKYAAEDGFKSIVSLLTYETDSSDGKLPSTLKARHTAEAEAGIQFATVLQNGNNNWKTADAVVALGTAIKQLPEPILFFSDQAYAATFLILAHFANENSNGVHIPTDFSMSSRKVFEVGVSLGFSFGEDPELINVVASLTGDRVEHPPLYDGDIPEWYNTYWQLKPVSGKWFVSGQIQNDHLDQIRALKFAYWTNSRKLTQDPPGKPSQEEVTLLNIDSEVNTYTGSGRQTDAVLKEIVLDRSKPTEYVAIESKANYESQNPLEFGDAIGYNESIQRKCAQQELPDVTYLNLPIGGQYDYNRAMWEAFRTTIQRLNAEHRPLLMQCRTGYRSIALTLLAIAERQGHDSAWVKERAVAMGYFHEDKVLDLWSDILDTHQGNKGHVLLDAHVGRYVVIAITCVGVAWWLIKRQGP